MTEHLNTPIGPPILVEIAHVVPASIRVEAADLQVGDRVFDAFGGERTLIRVRQRKNIISTRRDDHNHDEHWALDQPFTIIRAVEGGRQ